MPEILQSRFRHREQKAEEKKIVGEEEMVECSVCGNSFPLGHQVISSLKNCYTYPEHSQKTFETYECIGCRVASFDPQSRIIKLYSNHRDNLNFTVLDNIQLRQQNNYGTFDNHRAFFNVKI